jgi:glycosyltransferase involved in cell wall biosynthesis
MANPSISVIIPAFNARAYIAHALASVLAQSRPADEIILIDDGSTDDTASALQPFNSRIRYIRQPNQGAAAARNAGIAVSRGEYIAFLDADDLWHPRKLELQSKALTSRPDLALLGTQTFPAGSPLPNIDGAANISCDPISWPRLVVKNRFVTSSILAHRRRIEEIGLFDPSLHGPEDHDLWARVAERYAVANLALPLTGYRIRPESLSHRPDAMGRGMLDLLHKLDTRSAWGSRRLLRRRAYGYCHYARAYLYLAAGYPQTAIRDIVRSLLWYPLPYRRDEIRFPLARCRMVLALVERLCINRSRPAQPFKSNMMEAA